MTAFACIVFAATISADPFVSGDVLEPSVQNEVDHALSRAPVSKRHNGDDIGDPLGIAGLSATDVAIRLVSMQRADGTWRIGTNDVTAIAVDALLSASGGMRVECRDGVCRPIDGMLDDPVLAPKPATNLVADNTSSPRIAVGYMDAKQMLDFLGGRDSSPRLDWGLLALLIVFLGGLALNLTPCVLPMIPVNAIVIGRSAARGAWYGLGIALAYGALGLAAAIGGLAFGTIQSHPAFNFAAAAIFASFALSLLGVFSVDLSKGRRPRSPGGGGAMFAFAMGAFSALLAGACVAPVLISVLLLTADLYARGNALALALPFVLGLGMAAPWPFVGAGLRVLPRPGAWMKSVNRAFAVLLFAFSAWYASLGVRALRHAPGEVAARLGEIAATPNDFASKLASVRRPVFVDCTAPWCKNCAAMDRTTFADSRVREALKGYSVIRLDANDMKAFRRIAGFESINGLPAFVIYR